MTKQKKITVKHHKRVLNKVYREVRDNTDHYRVRIGRLIEANSELEQKIADMHVTINKLQGRL